MRLLAVKVEHALLRCLVLIDAFVAEHALLHTRHAGLVFLGVGSVAAIALKILLGTVNGVREVAHWSASEADELGDGAASSAYQHQEHRCSQQAT